MRFMFLLKNANKLNKSFLTSGLLLPIMSLRNISSTQSLWFNVQKFFKNEKGKAKYGSSSTFSSL